jgi:microcystin-dependent protein
MANVNLVRKTATDTTSGEGSFRDIFPAGVVLPFAGSVAPDGWLLCDGSAISRTTYNRLFSAISTIYGIGDGVNTFNVPDFRGRTVCGKDDMGGVAANRITAAGSGIIGSNLGAVGGSQNHVLSVSEMPIHNHLQDAHNHLQDAHNHLQDAHTHSQNAHNHTIDRGPEASGPYMAHSNTAGPDNGVKNTTAINNATVASNQSTTASNQSTTASNQNTGGSTAHLNMQPSIIVNYILKT